MSRPIKFLIALGTALLTALLAGAAGWHYSESLPKVYASEVTFAVRESENSRKDLRGFSQTQQEDMEMRKLSEQILSQSVLSQVSSDPEETRTLRQNISIEPIEETRLLQLRVKSRTPEEAASLASQVVESFTRFKTTEAAQIQSDLLESLRQEHEINLNQLAASRLRLSQISETDSAARQSQQDLVTMHQGLVQVTESRLEQMLANQARGEVVSVVQPAEISERSIYPNGVLIAGFSAAGGLLVGFVASVVFFVQTRKR